MLHRVPFPKSFLIVTKKGMIKGEGYEIRICRGQACPLAALGVEHLGEGLAQILDAAQLGEFYRSVSLKSQKRYRFRVAVSACPNACTQVHIADFGLIAQVVPRLAGDCVACGVCEEVCEEGAVTLQDRWPLFDVQRCLNCGLCIRACPKKVLEPEAQGFKILVGGKLGRHPRLARELKALATEEEVLKTLSTVLSFYKTHCQRGERLGSIIERLGWETFLEALLKSGQDQAL